MKRLSLNLCVAYCLTAALGATQGTSPMADAAMRGDKDALKGLIKQGDLERAIQHQRDKGTRLGESLVALGIISQDQLDAVIFEAPPTPKTVAETGIGSSDLLKLLLKAMYINHLETPGMMGDLLCLSYPVIQQLLQEATQRQLVQIPGATSMSQGAELRYALTERGRGWAVDALNLSQYVGPAPVPLSGYQDRILRQRITNERVDRETILGAFSNLVVSEALVRRLGPAINSGRSVLLYGPPGNGKTTIAEKVGRIFQNVIYVPYCVEVEGQIMKVYDAAVHQEVTRSSGGASGNTSALRTSTLRKEEFDRRWVPCRRPIIITGLTASRVDIVRYDAVNGRAMHEAMARSTTSLTFESVILSTTRQIGWKVSCSGNNWCVCVPGNSSGICAVMASSGS